MDDTPMVSIEASDPDKVADGALFLASKPPSRLQPSQRAHLRSLEAARLVLHHFGRGREPRWVADSDLFAVLMALLEAHTAAPCPPIAGHFGGTVGAQAAAAQRRALREWQRRAAKGPALPPAARNLAATAAALIRAYTAPAAATARSQLFMLQALERSFYDGLENGDAGLEEALSAAGTLLLPCDVWGMFKVAQASLADAIPLPEGHVPGSPCKEDITIIGALQAAVVAAGARPWPLVRGATGMLSRRGQWDDALALGEALLASALRPPSDPLRVGDLAFQVASLQGIADLCGVWEATSALATTMAQAAAAFAASEAIRWADPGLDLEGVLAEATLFCRSWNAVEGLSASGLVERFLILPGNCPEDDGTVTAAVDGGEEAPEAPEGSVGVETAQQGRPDPGEVEKWECVACGTVTAAAQVCGGCKREGSPAPAFYCSRNCQKAHWAQHRLLCEGYKKKEGVKGEKGDAAEEPAAAPAVLPAAEVETHAAAVDAVEEEMKEAEVDAEVEAEEAVAAVAVVEPMAAQGEGKETEVEMDDEAAVTNGQEEPSGMEEDQGLEKKEGEKGPEGVSAVQELLPSMADLINSLAGRMLSGELMDATHRAAQASPDLNAALQQRLDADPALAARVNRAWEGKEAGGGMSVGEVVCQVVAIADAAGAGGGGGGGGGGPNQSDPGCCSQ